VLFCSQFPLKPFAAIAVACFVGLSTLGCQSGMPRWPGGWSGDMANPLAAPVDQPNPPADTTADTMADHAAGKQEHNNHSIINAHYKTEASKRSGIRQTQYFGPPADLRTPDENESSNPIMRSLRRTARRIEDAITVDRAPANPLDNTSLANQPGPLGADLYVAGARLAETRGNTQEAIELYLKAIQTNPMHRNALLGLARAYHRQGQLQQSIRLCLQAIDLDPQDATAQNDLALCYARAGQLQQAAAALEQAVQNRPDSQLYRNNLATILVEMGRVDDAWKHLSVVHGDAKAHYNVAYLLAKGGQTEGAVHHASAALQQDPQLKPAQHLLARLQPSEGTAAASGVPTTRTPAPS